MSYVYMYVNVTKARHSHQQTNIYVCVCVCVSPRCAPGQKGCAREHHHRHMHIHTHIRNALIGSSPGVCAHIAPLYHHNTSRTVCMSLHRTHRAAPPPRNDDSCIWTDFPVGPAHCIRRIMYTPRSAAYAQRTRTTPRISHNFCSTAFPIGPHLACHYWQTCAPAQRFELSGTTHNAYHIHYSAHAIRIAANYYYYCMGGGGVTHPWARGVPC